MLLWGLSPRFQPARRDCDDIQVKAQADQNDTVCICYLVNINVEPQILTTTTTIHRRMILCIRVCKHTSDMSTTGTVVVLYTVL